MNHQQCLKCVAEKYIQINRIYDNFSNRRVLDYYLFIFFRYFSSAIQMKQLTACYSMRKCQWTIHDFANCMQHGYMRFAHYRVTSYTFMWGHKYQCICIYCACGWRECNNLFVWTGQHIIFIVHQFKLHYLAKLWCRPNKYN